MPSHVLKTAPYRDCYVIWSTVVDAPTFIGTRAETETKLKERGEWDERRMPRADATGSSARWPSETKPYGGWDAEGFIVANTFREHPFRWLARGNLEAFTHAVVEDRLDDALGLTEPCEDD